MIKCKIKLILSLIIIEKILAVIVQNLMKGISFGL